MENIFHGLTSLPLDVLRGDQIANMSVMSEPPLPVV